MAVSKDFYYKLSSEIELERLEAATGLLSALTEENNKEDWDYALNRLIKGLTSSRQNARFGFSLAITELARILILKGDYHLTISSFLQKLVDASKLSRSMKGKQVRALLFGRLFGFQAILNSLLLLDANISAHEDIKAFVRHIVELSAEKSWLRETAMYTLCQFLSAYLQSSFVNDETTLFFLQSVSDEGLTFTTEGLAVHLTIPRDARARIASQVSANSHWKHFDPMSRGNMPILAKVLKDSEVVENADNGTEDDFVTTANNVKQKGSWSPKLPFVWELLLKHYTSNEEEPCEPETNKSSRKRRNHSSLSSSSRKRSKNDMASIEQVNLAEFWHVVVDQTFFSEKASSERKYWGFEIFNKFIVTVGVEQIPDLFGANFMRCLMSQASLQSKLLNKMTTKSINIIIESAQSDLSKVVPLFSCLIDEDKGGLWNFDCITKSKAIDALIGVFGYVESPEQVPEEQAVKLLMEIKTVLINKFDEGAAAQGEQDAKSAAKISKEGQLKWVLDKLSVLYCSTKRLQCPPTKLLDDIFKFLIKSSFFKEQGGLELSENTIKLCNERLASFLSETISTKRKDHSWAYYCLKQIEKKEKDSKFSLILELSEDLQAVKDDALETVESIKLAMKKDLSHKDQFYCFELLFSMVLLQLYQGESEAVSVLEELKVCHHETFAKSNDDFDTSTIMIEIILSFISRRSALLRKLCSIVWRSFMCTKDDQGNLRVRDKSFQLLFNVLAAKENEDGQKKLFEANEGFEDDDDNEDDDKEDDDKEDDDEDDEGESEDSDVERQESKQMEQVEQETTIKLASALGIPTGHSGEVKFDNIFSIDDEDDNYESESMDDEQMMAIDEDLARIFKERRDALTANSEKKKNDDKALAKEQIILFKSRVLDLLDSFSKVQPNSVHNLSFIRPLIGVINLTTEKDLGMKAHKILKTRISKMKLNAKDLATSSSEKELQELKESLLELLKWLQIQAGKYSSSQAHNAACNQSCIIVSKSLLALDPLVLDQIVAVYANTLTTWASESSNRIQANMFFDFVNWLNSKRRSGSKKE